MMVEARKIAESGTEHLTPYMTQLAERPAWRWSGRVVEANGQTVEAEGPLLGGRVLRDCRWRRTEASGGGDWVSWAACDGDAAEGNSGNSIWRCGAGDGVTPGIAVGTEMKGRIVDALGSPLDGLPMPRMAEFWPLDGGVPHPMEREPISEPLQTGIRVLDGMLTVGRGQRVGIFGGSGVGKSTLIGMMTRNTAADLTVVGLVGERGREVREFVEDSLGEEGRKRSVVLVSTSDQSPLLRMRAAMAATSVAEFYAGAESMFCWCWIR